ncbi:MAG: glycoside hydrolase family 19 protein [Pseudomonadota bacterium]
MNLSFFFDAVRSSLFRGRLTTSQVEGMEFILEQWNETGFTDRQWLAYALATAFVETAYTMQPIREYGRGRGKKYGKPDPVTGQTYYGRGYVQLTWKFNYETASRSLDIDFVKHPDLVMEPHNAAFIMFQGMKDGWFTGRGFADYINSKQRDYWNARRIINGTDRAGEIAGYALKFEAALVAACDPSDASTHIPPSRTSTPESQSWPARLLLALWKAFRK